MMEQRQDIPIRTLGDNKIIRHFRNLAVFEIAFYFAIATACLCFPTAPRLSGFQIPSCCVLCF